MSETNDHAILFPDQEITIDGEKIVVREFRYLAGLEVTLLARPFMQDLRALALDGAAEINPEDLNALIARHREVWLQLIALSCGREPAWIAQLRDREAMKLELAFWAANSDFFMRRLVFGAMLAAAVQERRSPLATSSPSSSAPASGATSTTSESA